MRKLLRRLFRFSLLALVIITGIIVIKTISYTSRQVDFSAITPVAINKKDVAQRLGKAITFPTISWTSTVDTSAFMNLDTYLIHSFPLVDSLLERKNINQFSKIYKWPGRNARLSPILLTGHLDVVPVETSDENTWEHPPFSGKITDQYIWGRGTLDDKLAIVGILEAVEQLLSDDYTPERTIYIAFGHDEETGGTYGAQAIAAHFAQEGVHFEYVIDEGMLIVEDAVAGLSKTVAIIGIAEKGYVTLTITAQVKEAGHSSMPPETTAIGLLSESLQRLKEHPFPADIDGALADFFDYVGPEMDLPYRVLFANRWLTDPLIIAQLSKGKATNASIRTTIAPTMLRAGIKDNVLPTRASAKVNFRIKPGETVESVLNYVRTVIDDERIILSVSQETDVAEPTSISATDAFGFEIIQKTIQEIFPDVVVAPGLVIGATDGKYYQEVSENVYRFLPIKVTNDDLKRIHGIDERISLDGYEQVIQFYYQLLKNSCQ